MKIYQDIEKNIIINNLNDWGSIYTNNSSGKHWKDGRSAKELARAWINTKDKYLEKLLDSTGEFKGIKFIKASPEYETKFDEYGKGRNHDLLILAKDLKGQVLISLEAKVDESFGEIIEDKYLASLLNRINGKSTFLPNRIEGLLANVFTRNVDKKAFDLRYQLLHGLAGTVAEAKKRDIDRAVFVINTFWEKNVEYSDAYKKNIEDLDCFVNYLSSNKIKSIGKNSLIGPFKTKDKDYLSDKVELYIMKVEFIFSRNRLIQKSRIRGFTYGKILNNMKSISRWP